MATQTTTRMTRDLKAGQRLHCSKCGSEIEIVQPCTCNPPDQVLRCCGRDMEPTVGQDVHLGDD